MNISAAEARLRAGVVTASADETQALAAAWAAELPPTVTLALHGDLGSGKTTFVQGLAAGWGIQERVTSPTFTVYNLHRGTRLLAHVDAYRLTSAQQLEELMLADFLLPPYCLAIEWPEHVSDWLPPGTVHLELSLQPDGRHRIRVEAASRRFS